MDIAKVAIRETPAESTKAFVAQVAVDLRQIAYDGTDLEFLRNAVRDYADELESNDLKIAGAIEAQSVMQDEPAEDDDDVENEPSDEDESDEPAKDEPATKAADTSKDAPKVDEVTETRTTGTSTSTTTKK